MTHISQTLRRAATTLAVTALALVATATGAAAHVTVQPGTAEQGGFSALSFRVPTERDDAATTQVEITFPAQQPLAFVSVKPHAGWSYQVEKATLPEPIDAHGTEITEAVATITWTADNANAAIKPGEYDEFSVSVGFLPEDDDQMVFKAVQTYDSGDVVRWIEEAAEGADEPEHPAPVLALTAAQEEQDTNAPAADDSTDTAQATGTAPVAAASNDDSQAGVWLGAAALLVALAAAVMAALALRRPRAA